jgi:uncharacterized protein YhfF
MRALELGVPGPLRARLNALVLAGAKRGTAGLLDEYAEEGEALEHVGERLALLDDDGQRLATVEVTDVQVVPFADVPWEFAAAEGEGDRDLEEWRASHLGFWAGLGTVVTEGTSIVLVWFEVV